MLLMTKAEYAGKVPLFLGIDEAKFRKMVLPGDTLEICAELVRERAEKAIATCGCKAYVKGELAAECEHHDRYALRQGAWHGRAEDGLFRKERFLRGGLCVESVLSVGRTGKKGSASEGRDWEISSQPLPSLVHMALLRKSRKTGRGGRRGQYGKSQSTGRP